jgi:hypothetical protein
MPLTATSWNYVVLPTDASPELGPAPYKYRIENKQRIVRVRAELTNASNGAAYPTSGGIPLSSTPGDWGMIRNVDYVILTGAGHTVSGRVTGYANWVYAPTSHSIVGFQRPATGSVTAALNQELTTAWTPTLSDVNTVLYFEARGW